MHGIPGRAPPAVHRASCSKKPQSSGSASSSRPSCTWVRRRTCFVRPRFPASPTREDEGEVPVLSDPRGPISRRPRLGDLGPRGEGRFARDARREGLDGQRLACRRATRDQRRLTSARSDGSRRGARSPRAASSGHSSRACGHRPPETCWPEHLATSRLAGADPRAVTGHTPVQPTCRSVSATSVDVAFCRVRRSGESGSPGAAHRSDQTRKIRRVVSGEWPSHQMRESFAPATTFTARSLHAGRPPTSRGPMDRLGKGVQASLAWRAPRVIPARETRVGETVNQPQICDRSRSRLRPCGAASGGI